MEHYKNDLRKVVLNRKSLRTLVNSPIWASYFKTFKNEEDKLKNEYEYGFYDDVDNEEEYDSMLPDVEHFCNRQSNRRIMKVIHITMLKYGGNINDVIHELLRDVCKAYIIHNKKLTGNLFYTRWFDDTDKWNNDQVGESYNLREYPHVTLM